MPSYFLTFTCAFFLSFAIAAKVPKTGPGGDRVLQFLVDGTNRDRGWMLTEQALHYNVSLKGGGRWTVVFNREIFEKVTGESATREYRHRRLQTSQTRPGHGYLLIDNGGDDRYLLRTADFGENWKGARVEKARARTNEREDLAGLPAKELDHSPSPVKSEMGMPRHLSSGSQPLLHFLFDLLFHLRPGVSPWTFDNYHGLFLVDVNPRDDLRFSTEVSPSPRFFELAYRPRPLVEIRAGRIWVPFDELSPHHRFGGFAATSFTRPPGAVAFLPDLWTDLGVAVKYEFHRDSTLVFTGHLFVTNGFSSGGVDPIGGSSLYPDFSQLSTPDVNGDKGIGARLHAQAGKLLGVGVSAYTSRYTPQGDQDRRLNVLGADATIKHPGGVSARLGLMGMRAGTLAGDFNRLSASAEAKYDFPSGWFVSGIGGFQDADTRLTDLSDITSVGARFGLAGEWYELSIQQHRDIKDVPGKVSRDYSAFRLQMTF